MAIQSPLLLPTVQKRFRKVANGHAAEVWIELGIFGFRAELYEDGEFVTKQRGRRPGDDEAEVFLTGRRFSALIRVRSDGVFRCTWSR